MSIKDGPNAWPKDVAFKRLIRELWRQKDYVPPYQNLPPSPGVLAAKAARSAATPLWRKGNWELDVDEDDRVVLRHTSGRTVVIASPEGETDG